MPKLGKQPETRRRRGRNRRGKQDVDKSNGSHSPSLVIVILKVQNRQQKIDTKSTSDSQYLEDKEQWKCIHRKYQ